MAPWRPAASRGRRASLDDEPPFLVELEAPPGHGFDPGTGPREAAERIQVDADGLDRGLGSHSCDRADDALRAAIADEAGQRAGTRAQGTDRRADAAAKRVFQEGREARGPGESGHDAGAHASCAKLA